MMCNEEMKLWNELRTASFAMVELQLYLDTHCEDADAMALYHQYKAQRQNAMEALNLRYGPVTPYDVTNPVKWTWVCGPWPWEGEV